MKNSFWGLLIGLSIFLSGQVAFAEFSVPRLTAPVVDQAQLVSRPLEERLNQALRHIYKTSDSQLQVLTLKSLEGLTIEQASIQVADRWKLGSEKGDKGVLLLIAAKERKIRIEVGQGHEGDLPDAYAKRIIDEVMVPLFRSGNPEGGILLGVLNIAQRTNPDIDLQAFFDSKSFAPEAKEEKEQSLFSRIIALLMIVIFIIFFIRHPFLAMMLLSGSRRGGFGGGGFGGGGGWSGGGGGFSGGGASGGW